MNVAMTSITSTLEETSSRLASDAIVSFSSPDTLRLRLWSLPQRNATNSSKVDSKICVAVFNGSVVELV
jgi:hypothetical protein